MENKILILRKPLIYKITTWKINSISITQCQHLGTFVKQCKHVNIQINTFTSG